MKTYLVSYDLIQGKDYTRIIDAIKNYSYWAKPLESMWLIKSDQTVAEVRDNLRQFLDQDDRLTIFDVSGAAWASYNLAQIITDWMKSNL